MENHLPYTKLIFKHDLFAREMNSHGDMFSFMCGEGQWARHCQEAHNSILGLADSSWLLFSWRKETWSSLHIHLELNSLNPEMIFYHRTEQKTKSPCSRMDLILKVYVSISSWLAVLLPYFFWTTKMGYGFISPTQCSHHMVLPIMKKKSS